jgi:hypothetical protein
MRESVCDGNSNALLGLPRRDMPWHGSVVRINGGGKGILGSETLGGGLS